MKHEFLSQQCTQSKSRVQLHSSGCTKQMEKLVFGRLIKNAKSGSVSMMGAGRHRFVLPLLRTDGALAQMPGSWAELTCLSIILQLLEYLTYARQERHLRMSEPLCVDTPSMKAVQNIQFWVLGKKKEIYKQEVTSAIVLKLYFSPICLHVAVKRNSLRKYCMGQGIV